MNWLTTFLAIASFALINAIPVRDAGFLHAALRVSFYEHIDINAIEIFFAQYLIKRNRYDSQISPRRNLLGSRFYSLFLLMWLFRALVLILENKDLQSACIRIWVWILSIRYLLVRIADYELSRYWLLIINKPQLTYFYREHQQTESCLLLLEFSEKYLNRVSVYSRMNNRYGIKWPSDGTPTTNFSFKGIQIIKRNSHVLT